MRKYFIIILITSSLWMGNVDHTFGQTFSFSSLGSGLTNIPYALKVYKNELYVGGLYDAAGGLQVNCISRWNGSQWKKVGNGIDHASMKCFGIYNNILLMGGPFSGVLDSNGSIIVSNKLVGWDGENWVPYSLNCNVPTEEVYAIAEFQGDLYICGNLFHIGSLNVNRIAKKDAQGWHDIGVNVIDSFGPPSVRVMAVYNNELYVGGCFCKINNVFANNIARWDGTQWHPVGTGTSGCVTSFYTDTANNVLWVGGGIGAAGGISTNGVAIWDGQQWTIPGVPTMCGALGITKFNNMIFVGSPACGDTIHELSFWNGVTWGSVPQITDGVRCLAEYQSFLYLGGVFPGFPTNEYYILRMQMSTNVPFNNTVKKKQLGNNIPNPFSGNTVIPYIIPLETGEAYITIHDVFGKVIGTYKLDATKTQIEISLTGFENGVYSYSLLLDGQIIETKRMVLIK